MVGRRTVALSGVTAAIVLLASCLSILVAHNLRAPVPPKAQIDLPAPSFALMDLDAVPTRLSQYRGKVVVLAFLDTRCPVSDGYRDRLAALTRHYAGRDDFVLLSVISTPASEDAVRLRELRVQRQVLGDALPIVIDRGGEVARQYGVSLSPSFCVIDAAGTLRYVGAFDDHRDAARVRQTWCADAVEQLLQGQSVRVRETSPSEYALRS